MSIGTGIGVLVVDDQAVVRAGFRTILAEEPDIEVVGQAGDGAEGVRQARSLRPDVVLMDIRMPVMDGLEATRRITAEFPDGPPHVLILTTFDPDEYVFAALRAGAGGFLLKDAEPADILTAVRVVAAGESLLAPQVTRRLIEEFVRSTPRAAGAAADLARLTRRETEVLALAARGLQRRDRRGADARHEHHQDPHEQRAQQAAPARPGAGHHLRLRCGAGPARRVAPGRDHQRPLRPQPTERSEAGRSPSS